MIGNDMCALLYMKEHIYRTNQSAQRSRRGGGYQRFSVRRYDANNSGLVYMFLHTMDTRPMT